jgi:hypothetical protein
MTDFDHALALRLQRLDAAIPNPLLPATQTAAGARPTTRRFWRQQCSWRRLP